MAARLAHMRRTTKPEGTLRQAKPEPSEGGNATVEFVGILVVIVLPALLLIASLATIVSAQFAVQAAARDGARELVRAQSFSAGYTMAQETASAVWAARGLEGRPTMSIECDSNPCLSPDGTVTVTISGTVQLPLTGIAVEVSDTQRMAAGEFRTVRP